MALVLADMGGHLALDADELVFVVDPCDRRVTSLSLPFRCDVASRDRLSRCTTRVCADARRRRLGRCCTRGRRRRDEGRVGGFFVARRARSRAQPTAEDRSSLIPSDLICEAL